MDTVKNLEAQLRRKLTKHGYRLCKTPARSWLRAYYGPGYMVLEGNTVVLGCCQREYDATLEEVAEWSNDRDRRHV